MIPPKGIALLTCLGVGVYAAVALSCVNQAGHAGDWGSRFMFAAFGLYAASGAVRLAGRRRDPSVEAGPLLSAIVVVGALLPLAARPEGRVLWGGGTWLAAAGAFVGLAAAVSLGESFGLAPADRGTVTRGPYAAVRHPMAASFILLCGGFLLVNFSPWNAAVLGTGAALSVAAAWGEERILWRSGAYRDYAARVRWRFVPWLV